MPIKWVLRRRASLAAFILAVVAIAGAVLSYTQLYGYVGGGGRAVCSPSRVGGYLLEAYISPATPLVGESFQISAVASEEGGAPAKVNLTLVIVGRGRIVAVEGPVPAYNGIASWRLTLREGGTYDVTLLIAGEKGVGEVLGAFKVFSRSDAEAHSAARTASITALLVGVPLLLAVVASRLFSDRE
jgi:hypothetical protein